MQVFRILLLPFSIIYGAIVWLRNRLFDIGILKSIGFDFPLIIIGNLSTGGTGKTPHTEYLIRLLMDRYKLAMLSRGYKRKSSGFVLAKEDASALLIGDEPMQVFKKYPQIDVAVCEKRVEGVNQLLSLKTKPQVIILDDAFQHRMIKSEMNILLTDYSSPFYNDFPLPSGNLRDNRSEKDRAQIIVMTKCPGNISVRERESIKVRIGIGVHQEMYFTKLAYLPPRPFYPAGAHSSISQKVILITGIANSTSIESYINKNYTLLKHLKFQDHHNFSSSDIQSIHELIDSFVGNEFSILTTEKDYVRLKEEDSFKDLPMFYQPIEIEFIEKQKDFDTRIITYIKTHI